MEKKIIAEIGSSHDGSFGNAVNLIQECKNVGVDFVKFQLHIPEAEMLENAPSPSFFNNEDRFSYFSRTRFDIQQLEQLKKITENLNMHFLVSPFSEDAVEILEKIDVNFYKIASGEVTNHRLLEKIAKTKKMIFLSSGMSNLTEIKEALKIFKNNKVVLMQCTSIYPCSKKDVGLNMISELHQKFGVPIGYSDHYIGFEASFAAAALGAVFIEKHITFSRKMYGSDAPFAMEVDEFKAFSEGIKSIWCMLENPVEKNDLRKFKKTKIIFEKSVVTKKEVKKNKIITIKDIDFKKPGDGISAMEYRKVLGLKAKKKLNKNHKLSWSDLC